MYKLLHLCMCTYMYMYMYMYMYLAYALCKTNERHSVACAPSFDMRSIIILSPDSIHTVALLSRALFKNQHRSHGCCDLVQTIELYVFFGSFCYVYLFETFLLHVAVTNKGSFYQVLLKKTRAITTTTTTTKH